MNKGVLTVTRPTYLVVGQISHETNVFSPILTGLDQFQGRGLAYKEGLFEVFRGTKTGVGGVIDAVEQARAAGRQVEIIPTIAASAVPSGLVTRDAYAHLLGTLLDGIKEAKAGGRLDGVVLILHGAMVVDGITDAEGDILEKVRKAVGKETPVVSTLDLHGNISEKMVANADAFFGYDTNPHVDPYERAVEATGRILEIIDGKIHPVMAIEKLKMMPPTINMRTAEGPMVRLFTMAREFEAQPKVINVSVFGGFPFADIPEAGSSVVAVTDNDPALAAHIVKTIGQEMWNTRRQFLKPITSTADAVRHAMSPEAQAKGKPGPIILADVADNCGGGGSGDTTVLLQALLDMGAQDVGFAIMWDSEAVRQAEKAGVGGTVTLDLGGKTVPAHGKPVHVTATVKKLTNGEFVNTGPMGTGLKVSVGPTALLQAGGVEIITISNRMAPNDPEIFRHVGIAPEKKTILVVKSRGHFRAGYEPFAKEIVEVDCPGAASPNLSWFEYRHIPRPMFPLDPV
jgi:microcystin degradation protein MlrC